MTGDTSRSAAAARHTLATVAGFHTSDVPRAEFTAKPGSHDDGPGHGMFLGGIGGPAFSRDLSGRFTRWHLQPGTHLLADVESAFLMVHWQDEAGHHSRALRRDDVDQHDVSVLFPVSHETFRAADMPFVVTLAAYSPVVGGTEDDAGLPVVVFDVDVEPVAGQPELPAIDVALFWPNLNGWRASWVTSQDRGDRAWPGHHHAGNHNVGVAPPVVGGFVLQRRDLSVGGPRDVSGEVCVAVTGDADGYSRQVQYRTGQATTGLPDAEEHFTLGAVRHGFATTGQLGVTPDDSWRAHWHEPIGSAVAAHLTAGRRHARTRFVLASDWPYVRFGEGRCWIRRYAALRQRAGQPVPDATALARYALDRADQWLTGIDEWHERTLSALTSRGWSGRVAGCVVNELGLVSSLGTTWVDGVLPGQEPDPELGPLRNAEHLGLLEGFDEGYFYYDTSDLWHYAFPALTATWPRLGDTVFGDLSDALAGEIRQARPVYRVTESRQVLVADKLPHDLGNPAEDPFVRLNGYVMRDDPNTWRDSNPAFILAWLLHARLSGQHLDETGWRRLRAAAEVTTLQDPDGVGVPRHDEFGDSTWDNLALRGFSTYTTSLCAGMWAALGYESRRRGEDLGEYDNRLDRARQVLDALYTGEFYRAASEGKYRDAVMPDSVFGLFYADLLGAPPVVERERLRSHLRAGHRIAHLGYADGRVGPLLIAEPGRHRYERDGGQELQVNEVLLGSAWMFAAMLRHYDLPEQADQVAGTLRDVLYGGTGLQFRTPAAVDGYGRFRAPLNLRPLAAWWLAAAPESAHGAGTAGVAARQAS